MLWRCSREVIDGRDLDFFEVREAELQPPARICEIERYEPVTSGGDRYEVNSFDSGAKLCAQCCEGQTWSALCCCEVVEFGGKTMVDAPCKTAL